MTSKQKENFPITPFERRLLFLLRAKSLFPFLVEPSLMKLV
jgi:hypothetical protein